jgi:PhzF family phenazine biosynthesis protein
VAVVLDAEDLTTSQMQAFATWMNLSETTFVLPPSDPAADYRVRIFTPGQELAFAGHPTLGTCHAWRSATGSSSTDVVQECGVGLVEVREREGQLAFAAPVLVRSGPVAAEDLNRIARGLGIETASIRAAQWVDNGPGWVAVLLNDADEVLGVRPGPLDGLFLGVVGALPEGGAADVEVRAFFPVGSATVEDPVTGSLNASLAGWLTDIGVVGFPYTARQGTAMGREGLVRVHSIDGQVWVSGSTRTLVEGHLDL